MLVGLALFFSGGKQLMDNQMEILMMERDTPELLKQLDIGDVEVVVKGGVLTKKRIIVRSNVLYKLEEEGKKLLDLGHEIIKPIDTHDGKYIVVFTFEKNPNSAHLELGRTLKELEAGYKKLRKKYSEDKS